MKQHAIWWLSGLLPLATLAADPFTIRFDAAGEGNSRQVSVMLGVPRAHHIYADKVTLQREDDSPLTRVGGDRPVRIHDAFSGQDLEAYTNDVTLVYALTTGDAGGTKLRFSYQGCDEKECFFPQQREFKLPAAAGMSTSALLIAPETGPIPGGGSWGDTRRSHQVAARAAGYLSASEFLAFLDRAEGRSVAVNQHPSSVGGRVKAGILMFSDTPAEFLARYGVWWTLLLILAGGFLLNLTPCVLPMIPVNLAILGVGAKDSTRGRGFLLGAAYGAGITIVYGVLGLAIVLTGGQFGALNSLPGFNLAIGFLFVLLGLAMFDKLAIDFSRLQAGHLSERRLKSGSMVAALLMGGVAALLAGACVAPVVIAVLLLSGNLYAHGAVIGLAFPFLLGLGMALPWPLAGAGLACLPRPGTWMLWVKRGFGIFIMVLAVYYVSLAIRGWRGATVSARQPRTGVHEITVADRAKWDALLMESKVTGKPVLVDFWATWCKNCEAMELGTFRDGEVRRRLANYMVVKLQVEQLANAGTRAVTEAFEVKGLPTYVVLVPGMKP